MHLNDTIERPCSDVLSPAVAALSMSGTTFAVAVNALMLKRTKLAGIKSARSRSAPATNALVSSRATA